MDYNLILEDKSSSSEQRIQAVFQLIVEASPKAVGSIVKALQQDPSPIVRHECAFALGEINSIDTSDYLFDAIKSDENKFVVHEAALALSNLGNNNAKPILQDLLDQPDRDIILTAKIALYRLKMRMNNEKVEDYGAARDIILNYNMPEELRIQASFTLMEKGSLKDVEILIEALHNEPDPIVKHEIVFSLGETASHKAVPHLIEEMLSDDNIFVKHEAALALGTLGDMSAKEPLETLATHEIEEIAESAKIALDRLSSL